MKKVISICVFIFIFSVAAFAQGNGFNFQGRLNDGANPANGRYDLQFRLYDAIAGGNPIGAVLSRPNTTLINGVFSVTLDFGATAFNNPTSIYIEIALRPNGSPNAYTILGPRQQLTVVPFAVRAANATNADNATNATNATNAQNATNATTAVNAISLGGVAASEYARLNILNTGDLKATGDLQLGGTPETGSLNGNLSMSGDLWLVGRPLSGGGGNARQRLSANGLVKLSALVRVVRSCIATPCETLTPSIVDCYNSVTNSSTGNCGITFPNVYFDGVELNVGFLVGGRPILVTSGAGATGASIRPFPNGGRTVSVLNGYLQTSEFYIVIF